MLGRIDRMGIAALAAATLGGCVYDGDGSDVRAGDFADGTLLRLRLTRKLHQGSLGDCGLAPSWTWRYWSNRTLDSDGPNPRVPALSLEYLSERHAFIGQQLSVTPAGYREDNVRLFQGGTFSYTAWWWNDEEHAACSSSWEGMVEVVLE